MKKLNLNIIRINDKVRVVNPFVFKKVGYKLGISDFLSKISLEEKRKAAELLGCDYISRIIDGEECGYISKELLDEFNIDISLSKAFDKILNELAYVKLAKSGYGGKERIIHVLEKPQLLNKICTVFDKKIVKTGIYNNGGGDYEGDYTLPHLSNEKSHVILNVQLDNLDDCYDLFSFKIEAKNVEKIL